MWDAHPNAAPESGSREGCTRCVHCVAYYFVTDEQTIHVRLPASTYKALIQKRKDIGDDVPMSIVVRRLLDEALGVKKRRK
jgi:hypothetical protein